MTPWPSLTDVQADAVHATAAQHLRDPEELAAELVPILRDRPGDGVPRLVPARLEPRTMEIPVVLNPEAVWSLLGYSEAGSTFRYGPVAPDGTPVNDPLTPYPPELTP